MRILIVDDEPSILELLKAFLEASDAHEVVTAGSGTQALQIIERADIDFDCLLLDIQMPEMNGITLCENIRALPDYAHVPIIMLTAMSQKTYIDKAFSVGATDYVIKPFDFLELRGRLKAAERIIDEHNRAVESADAALRLVRDLGSDIKPHPEEAISIDGVERVVSYAAFENFVLTLSRTKLLFASAFAVQIADFQTMHQVMTARELRAALKSVAQVIADHVQDTGNLVCYRGNGVFLCINQRKTALPPGQREIQLNQALAYAKPLLHSKVDVRVSVGQEVSLVSISKAGALLALRRAVDQIEVRPAAVKELATLSKRVLRNQSRSVEQARLERRAYEMVLEDIVREEGRRLN